jgi:hypothetical protein
MLGESIALTHNSVSKSVSRINNDLYSGEYLLRTATEELLLTTKHIKESPRKGELPFERHLIELKVTTFATLTVAETTHVVTFTVRTRRGSDPADALKAAKALLGWTTDANVTKLIAWES